jgi:hypothetical protein
MECEVMEMMLTWQYDIHGGLWALQVNDMRRRFYRNRHEATQLILRYSRMRANAENTQQGS